MWVMQVTMQYNLCNEPWLKYSMGGVADRGLKHSQWTSARLNVDVLYVETHRHALSDSMKFGGRGHVEREYWDLERTWIRFVSC